MPQEDARKMELGLNMVRKIHIGRITPSATENNQCKPRSTVT